jgi:acyl-CoA thioester hydrolase
VFEPRSLREDFAFFHPLRVRWSELDPQGIVFNPNYFVYADVAFGEYLRALDFVYPQGFARTGSDTFAIHAEASFVGSAVYDDTLELGARVAYLGRTSFRVQVGVYRVEALLCELRMTYVNASLSERRPMVLPEEFVAKVQAHERVAPLRK